MAASKRVAVMIDLDYPVRHHYDAYLGIQRYAKECENWECVLDPFADRQDGNSGKSKYHGVIGRATTRLVSRMNKTKTPVVNIWLNSPVRKVPSVFADFSSAGALAAQHLIARGFEHLGFLGCQRDRAHQQFFASFRSEAERRDRKCETLLIPMAYGQTESDWHEALAKMQAWAQRWSNPIGIAVGRDLLCRYLVSVCVDHGLRIPEEVALITTESSVELCMYPEPSISAIDLAYERVGYQAASLLSRIMEGGVVPTEPAYVEPAGLIARQSTDAFAIDDELVSAALRFIAEHAHDRIRVGDVASAVATTQRTLERRFKAKLGRTIAHEINRFRVERAKRHLADTDMLIKQVAAASGFSDANQMYEVFRRIADTTPSDYRKRWREC